MTIYMPLFSCSKKLERLQNKVNKIPAIQGIYTGYNMAANEVAVFYHGPQGWNLFINEHSTEQSIKDILYFLLKNKRALLFDLTNVADYQIQIKIKGKVK